jgi:hypothetical protein
VAARAALSTAAIGRQIPRHHIVLVAPDQHGTARVTMGGLANGILDIARVDVPNACIHGDLPRHVQGLRWCWQGILQFPVRMEGREVQRHVGAEAIHHPSAFRFNFDG